ncbi:hypothetical protein IY40_00110 [Serratia marcescens]|uniref:hypothetical protein n=1 Tax=Serratia marcescens TaxID=615 RepID=UPI0004E75AB0|nr:hypothetical protein [Serratia marcescens]KFF80984.1 hypothetical protein IY40_00110 [Serratia marcescens]
MNDLKDLITRTAQARNVHLSTGTAVSWLLYENLYLALGRRALRPREGLIDKAAMEAMILLAVDKRCVRP